MKVYKLKDKLNFGKHKGVKLAKVIEKDPQYIEWCMGAVTWFKMNKIATIVAKKAIEKKDKEWVSSLNFSYGNESSYDEMEWPSPADFVNR